MVHEITPPPVISIGKWRYPFLSLYTASNSSCTSLGLIQLQLRRLGTGYINWNCFYFHCCFFLLSQHQRNMSIKSLKTKVGIKQSHIIVLTKPYAVRGSNFQGGKSIFFHWFITRWTFLELQKKYHQKQKFAAVVQ